MSVNILKDFISENAGPFSIRFCVQLRDRDVGSHDQDGCHIQSIYGIDLKRLRYFSLVLLG